MDGVCTSAADMDCSDLDSDCGLGVCDDDVNACVVDPVPDGLACGN